MSARAMCFLGIDHPAHANTTPVVLGLRNRLQVVGIDATPNAAFMV